MKRRILRRVCRTIERELELRRRSVTPVTRLEEELECDGIDRVSLACALEVEFDCWIDGETGWETVNDVAAAVRRGLEDR